MLIAATEKGICSIQFADSDEELEQARLKVETSLNAITARAYELAKASGRQPVVGTTAKGSASPRAVERK